MTLLDFLRSDHRFFFDLLDRLDRAVTGGSHAACGGPGEGVDRDALGLIDRLLARMVSHERVEERLLFPALRRFAPEVEPALAVIEADHQGLGRVFASFAREASAADRPPAWMILAVARMTNMVRSHIAREEADLFGAASRLIPTQELERLGAEAESSSQRKEDAGAASPPRGVP